MGYHVQFKPSYHLFSMSKGIHASTLTFTYLVTHVSKRCFMKINVNNIKKKNLGPNPDTGSFPTPPTTSLSARGSGQTEQNSLSASAPGQPHYVDTNQAAHHFNLGGS